MSDAMQIVQGFPFPLTVRPGPRRCLARRLLSAVALGLVLVLAAGACGDDGGPPPSPLQSPAPGGQPLAIDLAGASPLLTAVTDDPGDVQAGIAPLAAGDFNGDGTADLLIGAPFADGPDESRPDAGEAYVVFGQPGLKGEVSLTPKEVGLIVYGAAAADNLGFAVAAADLNDDGIDDVIVGAPGVTAGRDPRTDQGRAYVFFGSPELRGSRDLAAEMAEFDFVVTGAEGFSRLGHALASGDVNGDGATDLILGAPFAGREPGTPPGSPRTEVGEVYVVLGSSSLAGEVNIAFDQPDFVASGEQSFGRFGAAVAAGDLNRDGIEDIIVGGPQIDVVERDAAGAVYVFLGSRRLDGKRGVADAEISVYGADPRDALGETIASGDIDGDGGADLLLLSRSAEGPNNARGASGEAYLLLDLKGPQPIDLATAAADALIYGADPGDMFALSVAVTDVDGDGRDDAAFGVPAAGGPANARNRGGEAYLLFGDSLNGTIDLLSDVGRYVNVLGAEPDDHLGSGIAFGDLNGDGRPELVVSAAGPTGAEARPGKVYVLTLPER